MIILLTAISLVLAGPLDIILEDVQYGTALVGQPEYEETVADIFYPAGAGPQTMGFGPQQLPLAIVVRGGNENKPLASPPNMVSPLIKAFRERGYVVADPSFSVLDLTVEPFNVASVDVARVAQYLRTHADELNIDPQRVVMVGRSGGAFHSMAVGLMSDYQDLQSPDPVLHASSRPQVIVPWAGVTDFTCAHPGAPYMSWFFVGHPTPLATLQEKLELSPTTWLANPQDHDREFTPYIGLMNNLSAVGVCGSLLDPHDGLYGVLMYDAIEAFDQQSGPESDLFEQSILIDVSVTLTSEASEAAADWVVALPIMQPGGSWADVGGELAGAYGAPVLEGTGLLKANTPFTLTITNGLENSSAFLVVGFARLDVPFRGGLMVPEPTIIVSTVTNGSGQIDVNGTWTGELPGGAAAAYVQTWLVDPAGPVGLSASNGLVAALP